MSDNLRGILATLLASSAFVLNDAMVKFVSAELPSGEILVVRGVIAVAMLITGVVVLRATRPLVVLLAPMMVIRVLSAAAATTFIVISLRHLPLATVNTILQVTPLAATAGAAFIYREYVGWARWLATLLGFLGVVLIVKPGGEFGMAAYLALTALIFSTVRDLTTHGMPRGIPSVLVAAASAVAIMLSGFLVAPFDEVWRLPSARAWSLMTISGACLFIANTFIIVALRTGELSVVAPFRYTPVPLSVLLGYWWWNEIPDAIAALGMLLILAAGLYALERERRMSMRAERSPAQ